MTAFYNECEPFAAQWLRNLISAGHIAPGIVDERPIQEIEAFELSGFTQCHFFAGIGVWSYALRQAGWSDDRPIWTGSCPCQPFSDAGKKKGISDERHLWPYWHPLIEQRKPSVVVGEQVASKDGLGWLDLVSTDMEASHYAFGASDLCAAGVNGAHIRQRLYFVGLENPELSPSARQRKHGWENLCQQDANRFTGTSNVGGMGNPAHSDRGRRECGAQTGIGPDSERRWGFASDGAHCNTHAPMLGRNAADWLYCRDGKWRPVEPGTFPLVDATPARVGRLRAYGNALDAETAAEFCRTVKEICDGV